MIFRIDRFFLDEKDLFVGLFAVLLVVSFLLNIPLLPFRRESLVVLFLFLLITRSLVSQTRMTGYMGITLAGLLFALFLSPYGLAIYLFIAMLAYQKFIR